MSAEVERTASVAVPLQNLRDQGVQRLRFCPSSALFHF